MPDQAAPILTNARRDKGFTLVEIAIVIVGLLIGGVVKGAAMIESAQEKRLITDIQAMRTAIVMFRDRYGALPGDMSGATDRITGCDAASYCENGDGNGLIGSDGSDQYDWLSPLLGNGMQRETVQAWKHLALADLITGVEPSSNPGAPAFGLTHPPSRLGGGFEIYYDAFVGAGARPGHFLRLTRNGASLVAGTGSELIAGALTPAQAFRIDLRIDDGNPSTGLVLANYGTPIDECKEIVGDFTHYREADGGAACILYIHVSP